MKMSSVANACDILAALMWGPKLTTQISQTVGVSMTTTYKHLREMEATGLVGRNGERHAVGTWYLNRQPFGNELLDGQAEYDSWADQLRSIHEVQQPIRRHTLKG